jgi:hypothetical protein
VVPIQVALAAAAFSVAKRDALELARMTARRLMVRLDDDAMDNFMGWTVLSEMVEVVKFAPHSAPQRKVKRITEPLLPPL